jgi:hypothetical protein
MREASTDESGDRGMLGRKNYTQEEIDKGRASPLLPPVKSEAHAVVRNLPSSVSV